jgi:hypothetical protein
MDWSCVEFASESVCDWKGRLVSSEGIGTDVFPSVFAFDGDGVCLGWACLVEPGGVDDVVRCLGLAGALFRSGWHAEWLVFCAEGFVFDGDGEPSGGDLVGLFAAGDLRVSECLSFVGGGVNGFWGSLTVPYVQELGRRVRWLDGVRHDVDGGAAGSFFDVLGLVFDSVAVVPFPRGVSRRVCLEEIGVQVAELGFVVLLAEDFER